MIIKIDAISSVSWLNDVPNENSTQCISQNIWIIIPPTSMSYFIEKLF